MTNFNLNYIPNFDRERLNYLLKDFYDLTQIRITVFDANFHELTAYPEPFTPFCQLIHSTQAGHQACKKCDKIACEIAAKRNTPYTYKCHAGLTESITPLYLENRVVGYVFFGQIFSYDSYKEGWEEIRRLCSEYPLDERQLYEACHERPIITSSYIVSASHILQAVAAYLCLEQIVSLGRQELPEQIDLYISSHLSEKLDAQSICREFGIGKNKLYDIANENYGMGIAQHIREMRIDLAKKLLRDAKLPLAEIATRCGFKDYNYFITLFKKMTGKPPKKYAEQ